MSKKKKIILIGLGAILAISLISSLFGGDDPSVERESITLKAAQTEIKGDLKGCYELVDKEYKVKIDSYYDMITVELKRTTEELPYDRNNVTIFPNSDESSAEYCAGFGVEILDADGDVIDKQNANATPYSWDEMTAALQLLPEETTTIKFRFDNLTEAASIRVTSLVMDNEEKKKESNTKSAFDSLNDLTKKVEDIYENEDLDDLMEDYEDALEMSKKSMELADEMINLLGL